MFAMSVQIAAIAVLAAICAALPGLFLVLRRASLMSDAISHAVLPGIVTMFLLIRRLDSPFLMLGAWLAGFATVFIVEMLINRRCIKQDAAIGLIYPLFFSVGVIMVSRYARGVHLDADMVLLGDIAFAPLETLTMASIPLGPRALWHLGLLIITTSLLLIFFYKELVVASFDREFAQVTGLMPRVVHYGLMLVVSITAVKLFDVVGSIIVVSLMIVPPATALLCCRRLPWVIVLSAAIGACAACVGYAGAFYADISIAGSIAAAAGMIFLITFFCAPRCGIIATLLRHRILRQRLAIDLICCHLASHKQHGILLTDLAQSLGWSVRFVQKVVISAMQQGLISQNNDYILLNPTGHHRAAALMPGNRSYKAF